MHAHARIDNRVTLAFDLLILGSIHAERLPCTVCIPRLTLITQSVFFLHRGYTDEQTDTHT